LISNKYKVMSLISISFVWYSRVLVWRLQLTLYAKKLISFCNKITYIKVFLSSLIAN